MVGGGLVVAGVLVGVGAVGGEEGAGVVAEAVTALVLAELALEKFGGDSVAETRRNRDAYLADIAARGLGVRG